MAKLVYVTNTSLDGYMEDLDGDINWGTPDEEYFGFINDIERGIGTNLYGRRMYEAMVYWETAPMAGQSHWIAEFTESWRSSAKIVFSRSLTSVSSARTTLEREFDVDAIRQLKESASLDLTVGGAEIAARAFRAGLVDECHLFFWPVVLGGGKGALPEGARFTLELVDQNRLRSGIAHLHYRVTE